ncbi:MAG: 3-hydroxybutyrate dehydrogenase [Paracoccaceae bacterium]
MLDADTSTAMSASGSAGLGTLRGRIALVTGSTSGIGLGIATALARGGADIVLSGFGEPEAISQLIADMSAQHRVRVIHSPADLSKAGEVARLVAAAGEAFGRVDILVNNAGVFHTGPVEKLTPEDWNATLAVNLTAAFLATREALPGMKARGWGRILNLASALGLVGAPDASAYAASKHGIVGLTRSVALETATHGVTVNAICPGYVRTPLIEREIAEAVRATGARPEDVVRGFLEAAQPSRRFVETREIGALAAFLCGDDAASITGAAIAIDGGWTAR